MLGTTSLCKRCEHQIHSICTVKNAANVVDLKESTGKYIFCSHYEPNKEIIWTEEFNAWAEESDRLQWLWNGKSAEDADAIPNAISLDGTELTTISNNQTTGEFADKITELSHIDRDFMLKLVNEMKSNLHTSFEKDSMINKPVALIIYDSEGDVIAIKEIHKGTIQTIIDTVLKQKIGYVDIIINKNINTTIKTNKEMQSEAIHIKLEELMNKIAQ